MSHEIDLRLRQLIALWTGGSPQGLSQVPALCEEIAGLAARSRGSIACDPELLRRANRLSEGADQRLAACLEILSRTGSYSNHGSLELSSRIATEGWEG